MDLGEGGQGSQATATSHTHGFFFFFFLFTLTLPFIGSHLEPPLPPRHRGLPLAPPFSPFYYHSSMFCENFPEVMHKLGVLEDQHSLRR